MTFMLGQPGIHHDKYRTDESMSKERLSREPIRFIFFGLDCRTLNDDTFTTDSHDIL